MDLYAFVGVGNVSVGCAPSKLQGKVNILLPEDARPLVGERTQPGAAAH